MLIIDKIDGGIVTVEDDGHCFNADISLFDGDVKEGDVLLKLENGHYLADRDLTQKRKKEIIALQDSLWE